MKKIGILFASLVMLVMCAVSVSALEPTGQCGDNVYWSFDETTGELVISGEGDMRNYTISPFKSGEYTIKKITIEEGVTSIGNYAFQNCGSVKSIDIPDSVTYIGERAFSCCGDIGSIYISENVDVIGENAFEYCNGLTAITVDGNNEFYFSDDRGVLFNKEKTVLIKYPIGNKNETYTIPDGVEIIEEGAFSDSLYIKEITFPDSLKQVKFTAFHGCFGLTEIVLSDKVELIESGAFVNLPFLDKFVIKSYDAKFVAGLSVAAAQIEVSGISRDDYLYLNQKYEETGEQEYYNELEKYITYPETEISYIGTIYCHEGSTAEAYAKGCAEMFGSEANYELIHFFEGEWIYDAENKYCYRKCIHCDEREISEDIGDIEIEAPADSDVDFTVDVVTDYVIIEETVSNNVTIDFEIIKAFDITMTGKDGVHVQPDGTVKVKLPNDWSKKGVYKVYRINDDGTLTDMNAYRQGSHLVFDTDHFSVYVIVVEDEAEITPEAPNEPEEETKDSFFAKIIDLIKAFFALVKSWLDK